MNIQATKITPPKKLPFLEAICWQTNDVNHFTLDEMMDRYERGWTYNGVLGDLEGQEREFVRQLATNLGSWISGEL